VTDLSGGPNEGPRRIGRQRLQLGAEAASYVRDLIVSGQLQGGDFIRPESVAKDLGISATPVREGLLALNSQGFVRLEPRRGFVVIPLTGADIRDLFAGQALLAGELAARAVKRRTPTSLADLEQIHFELEVAAERGAHDELEELNFRFHRAVNRLADAPKIAWLLGVALRYAPVRFYSTIDGWPAATVHDHRALLDAFQRGASKTARSAMTDHIVHAGELLAIHIENGMAKRGNLAP
jgi:DNA-binding GntR family transcriptional regulator